MAVPSGGLAFYPLKLSVVPLSFIVIFRGLDNVHFPCLSTSQYLFRPPVVLLHARAYKGSVLYNAVNGKRNVYSYASLRALSDAPEQNIRVGVEM